MPSHIEAMQPVSINLLKRLKSIPKGGNTTQQAKSDRSDKLTTFLELKMANLKHKTRNINEKKHKIKKEKT
jgi:hypothetical protein